MSSIVWQSHREKNDEVAAYMELAELEWPGYPPAPIDPKWWRTPFAWITGRNENGEIVGGCEWIRREITVGEETYVIAALGGVVTVPQIRGKGTGGNMVSFATDFVAEEGYDWAVLFTGFDRRSFYERLGYSRLGGDIYVTKFEVRAPIDEDAIVMAKALRPQVLSKWPLWKTAIIDVGYGTW
jgi:GNAT superfamily N-acetyltransferase